MRRDRVPLGKGIPFFPRVGYLQKILHARGTNVPDRKERQYLNRLSADEALNLIIAPEVMARVAKFV